MPDRRLIQAADRAVARIVRTAVAGADGATGAQAPPGSGKTRLVAEVANAAVDDGRKTVVIGNNNEQVFQLTERIAARSPGAMVVFAPGSTVRAPAYVTRYPNVVIPGPRRGQTPVAAALAAGDVIICTADKASFLFCTNPGRRGAYSLRTDLLIVDEAYQLPWAKLQRTNRRFDQLFMVGDPGQLAPFSSATLPGSWRVAGVDHPIDPAPTGWEAAGYPISWDSLPASFRLPAHSAGLLADAFYPQLPFSAVCGDGDRVLSFRHPGVGAAGAAWDQAAAVGWAFRELPAARPVRADPEVADEIALVVGGLLGREPTTIDEEGARPLTADRIAVGVTHRDQRHAVAAALADRGVDNVAVHTANTIQGDEFDVVVVWHPLSGQVSASSFHIDAGRLCVLLSRHRHACVVVGRAGIDDLLAAYPPPAEQLCDGRPNPEPTGWESHEVVWRHLDGQRV